MADLMDLNHLKFLHPNKNLLSSKNFAVVVPLHYVVAEGLESNQLSPPYEGGEIPFLYPAISKKKA